MPKSISFYLAAALLVLLGIMSYQHASLKKIRADNGRLYQNLKQKDFTIKAYKTKSGKQAYVINSLELKNKEFKELVPDLENELKDMRIKSKNVQSVGKLNFEYNFMLGKIPTYKLPDIKLSAELGSYYSQRYAFAKNDPYITLSGQIYIPTVQSAMPLVDSLKVTLRDKLTIADDIQYKGWWFWKKPSNFRLHIKSTNPYFTLDTVQVYQLIK